MSLLKPENLDPSSIEGGDAGVILKLDGTMRVFTTSKVENGQLTDEQKMQAERLLIVAHVLQDPAAYALILDQILEMQEKGIEFVELPPIN